MLSHIATDLQQVYLEEVFTPQLGKPGASTPAKPKSSSDLDGDGDVDSFEKKVRQIIYDVRHIMKEKKVTAETAFKMRTLKTGFSVEMVNTAKEKLGIRGGGSAPVSEEILSEDDKVGIVVNYKNGTTYRKSVSRNSVQTELQKFRSNPNVSSVERTGYGLAKRDYDEDGKIESPSKEHAGAVHNAIQRKRGGVPDGQDTRGKTSKKKLKSYGVSEGFSNWRDDLCEIADEIKSKKKSEIKEEPGINNKVVINPEFKEEVQILGGVIVEEFELDEEYLNGAVDIAAEFFYNYGLNENGVDIVIEELGEEKFTEFVFDLTEEYFLSKEISKKIKEEIDYKTFAGKKVTADKTRKVVESAKETQEPSSEPRKQSIKAIVGEAIANPEGVNDPKSPRSTQMQKKVVLKQTDNAREKIGEDFETQTMNSQELNLRKKKASIDNELAKLRSKTVRQQKPQEKPVAQQTQNTELQNQSYEPEGDVIDERRREEKGTPRKPRDPAFEFVAKLMGSNRLGVQPRGVKQVPGQKPPVAGEYGASESPAQKLAKRKTEPTKVGSKFD